MSGMVQRKKAQRHGANEESPKTMNKGTVGSMRRLSLGDQVL